jgi:hypothetical protein
LVTVLAAKVVHNLAIAGEHSVYPAPSFMNSSFWCSPRKRASLSVLGAIMWGYRQPGAAGPKAAGAPGGMMVTVLAAKVVHNLASAGEQTAFDYVKSL